MSRRQNSRRNKSSGARLATVLVAIAGLAVLPQLLVSPSIKSVLNAYAPSFNAASYASETADAASSLVTSLSLWLQDPSSSNTPTSEASGPKRKWAYVYFITGCDPQSPGRYIGMLYNAVVAARVLRSVGSTVDIVVIVQMNFGTDADALPPEQSGMMQAAGVTVRYIDKPTRHLTFHEAVLNKFSILGLDDYSRVLYMDSDAIPICSLDYLFDLSEPDDDVVSSPDYTGPVLRENVVLAWKIEPSSAGFFMLRPGRQYHDELQAIIRRQMDEAFFIQDEVKFNRTIGWGHVFQGGDDVWTSLLRHEHLEGRSNTEWNWYGDISDQGLLYYWTKYHQRDVSIIISDKIEHWVDRNGTAVLHHRDTGTLSKYPCGQSTIGITALPMAPSRANPYRQFVHFTGRSKPWLEIPAVNDTARSGKLPPELFWWRMLTDAAQEHNFTIMFEALRGEGAPYGSFVNHIQLRKAVMAHAAEKNTTGTQGG